MDWNDILGAGGVVAMIAGAWTWMKARAQAKSAKDVAKSNERKAETIRAERVEVAKIEADALVAPHLFERLDRVEQRLDDCEAGRTELARHHAECLERTGSLEIDIGALKEQLAARDRDITRRMRTVAREEMHSTPPHPLRSEDVKRAMEEED